MEDLLVDLNKAYEQIQYLKVQPTKSNVVILNFVMNVLQEAYQELETIKKKQQQDEAEGGNEANGTD